MVFGQEDMIVDVALGDTINLACHLSSKTKNPQRLVIELIVNGGVVAQASFDLAQ